MDLNEPSLFFTTFVGEYVQVTTNFMVESATETEQGTMIQKTPVIFEGYLLDEDPNHYYLGSGPGEIEHCIKERNVIHIGIVKQRTALDDLMDSLPDAEKEEDFN